MRLFFLAIVGGCLIGLAAGCGGGSSNKVEIPENPTPPPENPPVFGSQPAGNKIGADQQRLPGDPGAQRPRPGN